MEADTPEAARKKTGLILGLVVGALVLLAVGGVVGNNLLYSNGFARFIEATTIAEHDQVWVDFFVSQDCFISAVIDEADADLARAGGLELLDNGQVLAAHVDSSLAGFGELAVSGFHGSLEAARDAIVAHYEVWDGHLGRVVPILATLDSGEDVSVVFSVWAETVVADEKSIADTFDAAEITFLDAARGGEAQDEVDALFTPADVTCPSGGVAV